MPWSTGDVDRFKKGLSKKQKEKWVAIANAVLTQCKSEGGKDCDGKAVRIANSRVGSTQSNNMEVIKVNNYTVRTEIFEGREHIVVPVVMMVEGVHNGSGGAIFHAAEELGHIVAAWNGIPVVIYHPQDPDDDSYISANSPEVIEQAKVGTIFNAFMDGNKLKAEAWIDVNKLSTVNPQTLKAIKNQETIEVSVGVFTDDKKVEGEWNGEHYTAIATNHRPDHLALLPNEVGACSVKDGCGIRANKEKNMKEKSFILVNEGYREVMDLIQNKLNTKDDGDKYHYLLDCFEDYFVYAVRSRSEDILYKQNYSIDTDGTILFNGDCKKVKRNVNYIEVNKEVQPMAKGKDCKTCESKVIALIANTTTPYEEKDKEALMEFDEVQLDQLLAMARALQANTEEIDKLKVNAEKKVEITKEDILKACAGMTKEEYLAMAPAEYKEQLQAGLQMQANKKAEIITKITANSKAFTKEELEGKALSELDKISSLIPEPVDYSGRLGGFINVNTEVQEGLYPAGLEMK